MRDLLIRSNREKPVLHMTGQVAGKAANSNPDSNTPCPVTKTKFRLLSVVDVSPHRFIQFLYKEISGRESACKNQNKGGHAAGHVMDYE